MECGGKRAGDRGQSEMCLRIKIQPYLAGVTRVHGVGNAGLSRSKTENRPAFQHPTRYFTASLVFSAPFFTPWPTPFTPFFTPCPVFFAASDVVSAVLSAALSVAWAVFFAAFLVACPVSFAALSTSVATPCAFANDTAPSSNAAARIVASFDFMISPPVCRGRVEYVRSCA